MVSYTLLRRPIVNGEYSRPKSMIKTPFPVTAHIWCHYNVHANGKYDGNVISSTITICFILSFCLFSTPAWTETRLCIPLRSLPPSQPSRRHRAPPLLPLPPLHRCRWGPLRLPRWALPRCLPPLASALSAV